MKTRIIKAAASAAVLASGVFAQQAFDKQSLLATNIPVIEIETENRANIVSKENYINIETFTLTDPANPAHNFTRLKSDAARPELDLPADQIRGRGNSSWAKPEYNINYPKKPYRVRFTRQIEMLGLPEARNWVLLAEFRDPTFLYNALAFEAAGGVLGMPFTHRYYHVHLILNGDYRGLYGLTEQNQVHKNRIDIDPEYGWYVSIDSYYDEEPKFQTSSYNLPVMIKSPELEPENMGNQGYNFVRNDWNALTSAMSAGNFPESGYRDLIDINALVDYLLVNEITHNQEFGTDDNIRSFLAYKDADEKITAGPVWDFDCGFGYNYQSTHRYFTTSAGFILKVPFVKRFYDDPVFKVRFRERWNEKYSQIGGITGYVETAGQKIRAAVAKDTERWLNNERSCSGFGCNPSTEGYVLSEYIAEHSIAVNQLKTWLNSRISWLNGQINSEYAGTISISSAEATLSNKSYVYDGSEKKPDVVVESYGKKLTEGTHYTLTYSNNTDVGSAAVTITGKGDYYSGSKAVAFAITSGSSVLSPPRVTPPPQPGGGAVVIAPAVILAGEFTAGPNPVDKRSGIVNFYRQGKRVNNCELRIYDAAGNIINRIKIRDNAIGNQARRAVGAWDLTDKKGRAVPEGTYLVNGVLNMSGGKSEKVSSLMFVF